MAQKTRNDLKEYFQTGDKPTQQEFADLIDSMYNKTDDAGSLLSAADKIKLDGIAAGAEVNVQPDWDQDDSDQDDFVKNKPGNATISKAGFMSASDKTKLDGVAAGAEVNVQPNWNEENVGSDAYIQNKPGNATTSTAGLMSASDKTKLNGVAAGAEVNVQPNWNEENVASDAYIQNKPGNATTSTAGLMSASDKTKMDGVESGATADQTASEIATAYNSQVAQVSAGEKTAGTETATRRFSPKDVADMAGVHGGGGASVDTTPLLNKILEIDNTERPPFRQSLYNVHELSQSEGTHTPILITEVNLTGGAGTIKVDFIPYREDLFYPQPGREWALVNSLSTGHSTTAAINRYIKINSVDYATNTLYVSDEYYRGQYLPDVFAVGQKVGFINPHGSGFEFMYNHKTGSYITSSTYGSIQFAFGGIFKHTDGRYIMIVSAQATSSTGNWSVGAFQSTDMMTWSECSGQPFLPYNTALPHDWFAPKSTQRGGVICQSITKMTDGNYLLGLAGMPGNSATMVKVGYCIIDEDLTVIELSSTEIIPSSSYTNGYSAPSIIYYNGEYHMTVSARPSTTSDYFMEHWKSANGTSNWVKKINNLISSSDFSSNPYHYLNGYSDAAGLFVYNNKLWALISGTCLHVNALDYSGRKTGLAMYDEVNQVWRYDKYSPVFLGIWGEDITQDNFWGLGSNQTGHLGSNLTPFIDNDGNIHVFATMTAVNNTYRIVSFRKNSGGFKLT